MRKYYCHELLKSWSSPSSIAEWCNNLTKDGFEIQSVFVAGETIIILCWKDEIE